MSRLRTALTAAGLLVLVHPVVARADDWGSQDGDTGANPDRASHSYCWGPRFIEPTMRQAVNEVAASALGNPTDAVIQFVETCVTAEPYQTDVRWNQGTLTPGTLARAPCVVYSPNGVECDRYDVTEDQLQLNAGPGPNFRDYRKTSCHELGHTVGLTHGGGGGDGGSDDCMVSGYTTDTTVTGRYSAHHEGHINAWF